MHNINETMCQGNDSNMFVTLFIGILDLPTGRLRYCDAGHDCPMIIKDGELHIESCNAHIPVGVFDDTKYDVQEMQLASESTIFLYTDGLTEAKDKDRKQYGLERVEEVLGKCAKRELMPKEILETVSEEVRLFVNGAEQSDDLTMLAINYSPRQFDSEFVDSLTIKNDVHEVSRFSEFMKSVTNKLNIEKSLAKQLRLAVEEAVVNAIDYAYTVDTDGEITVKILSDGHTMNVQIIDSGIPFDPTTKEKADTSLSAEDRQIGGLGILLVRELMDTINYERIDGKNVLTLIKHII